MRRGNDGFSMLAVMALTFLLMGLAALALSENIRLLRDNQRHADSLQARAAQIEVELP